MCKGRLGLGLPEKSGLITASRYLLEGSEAEVLQLDSTRPDLPPSVLGSDVLYFHSL